MTTQDRVDQARDKIREAARKHLAAGGKIVPGSWGVNRVAMPGDPGTHTWVPRGEGCCPLGAVLLDQYTTEQPSAFAASDLACRVVGMTYEESCMFMGGFDGRYFHFDHDPWFRLGCELREEFCP